MGLKIRMSEVLGEKKYQTEEIVEVGKGIEEWFNEMSCENQIS